MHGCGSRDWDRFHRRMRAFGRAMERDMRKMGEDIEADMTASGKTRRGGWCGPGSVWMFEADDGEDRRAERAARTERPAEHRAEDRAERRAERRAMRCHGGLWAYWWLLFPLFFLGKNAVEDAGGWPSIGAAFQGGTAWMLNLTFIAPLADLIAGVAGLSFQQAYGLLAVSAAICAGAAVLAWRAGRPRVGSKPI